MQVKDIMNHFRQLGKWVDWANTCDRLLHGQDNKPISGIATTWTATNKVIEQAAAKRLNLIVTHEPLFLGGPPPRGLAGTPAGDEVVAGKKALLNKHGITVIRCHDVWDRMPHIGIPDAWADFLGFPTEQRPVESYNKICLIEAMTFAEVATHVLDRVRQLGQDWVLALGDRDKPVKRMSVGTGAITRLWEMLELNIDLALLTDDGMNTWTAGYFAADRGLPILIVNHATAEKPGMMAMAKYLRQTFPDMPVEYLDVELPWQLV